MPLEGSATLCRAGTLGEGLCVPPGEGRGFLLTPGLAVLNEPDDVSEGPDDVAPLLGPGAGVPANVPYFMSCAMTRVNR